MDVEKTIEFLLEHHARFSVEMDTLKSNIAELRKITADHTKQLEIQYGNIKGLQANIEGLTNVGVEHQKAIARISKILEDVARNQNELQQSQHELQQSQHELQQSQHELQQSQRATDESLRALFKRLDDIIGRNGGGR